MVGLHYDSLPAMYQEYNCKKEAKRAVWYICCLTHTLTSANRYFPFSPFVSQSIQNSLEQVHSSLAQLPLYGAIFYITYASATHSV